MVVRQIETLQAVLLALSIQDNMGFLRNCLDIQRVVPAKTSMERRRKGESNSH